MHPFPQTFSLLLTALFLAAPAFAADQSPKGAQPAPQASDEDLEARLEVARARLDAAIQEVTELSTQAGKTFADRLIIRGPGPRRAIIGVQLDAASGQEGAKVVEVSPGSPAAEAGIRAGDVIVAVNGAELKGNAVREVTRIVRQAEPDTELKLRVLREGKPQEITVVTRAAPRMFAHPLPPPPPGAPEPGEHLDFEAAVPFMRALRGQFSDMELASLSPQLGRYFGTEEGVLVVRAPQEKALKLEDGDVILAIDGRKPTSGSHATRILRSYQSGETISLRIMRQRKPLTLQVSLPERRPTPGVRVWPSDEERA